MLILRDYQEKGVNAIRNAFKNKKRAPLYVLPTGGGKCLGKGTPILMFDGSIKKVENIKPGDLLMGPNSGPRTVLSICTGWEQMYRVTPVKGDPYEVNESHILSLKKTKITKASKYPSQRGGEIVNISVRDYVKKSKTFKHIHKGWRTGIDFNGQGGTIEPYYLGLWLGDGIRRNTGVTTGDDEIKDYLHSYANRLGLRIRTEYNSTNSYNYYIVDTKGRNPLYKKIRSYGLNVEKHIPKAYLTASRVQRLKILAGLLDSDGHYTKKGFDFVSVSERLTDDVVFLCRSLGFSAYKSPCKKKSQNGTEGDYFRISISGHIHEIPTKLPRKKATVRKQIKNVLHTGITVEPIGLGEYYGFEIDGDRLFLLGDFTVTHNTVVFSYIATNTASRAKRVLILVHRIELLRQTSQKLFESGVEHGLINPKFTPNIMAPVQIASVQTLVRRLDKTRLDYDLVIIDEAHHAVATTWKKILNRIPNAYHLGVTATPIRSDGTGLADMFDDLIIGPSIKELTDRGHLAKCQIYAPSEKLDLSKVKTVDGDYDKIQLENIVDNSMITGDAVKYYKKLCAGVPTIVFCVSVKHAEHVAEEFRAAGFRAQSVDGSMEDLQRRSLLQGLGNGNVQVITSCDLISEGTDVPAVTCGIGLRPTQSTGLFLQQVGRILRPFPGKQFAIYLDHVGNCLMHGLPDEDREWSLEGEQRKKKKKKGEEEPNIKVKQCPQCFAVHAPATKCPTCGHLYEVEDKQPDIKDGELRQLDEADGAMIKRMRQKEIGAARTFDELAAIATKRGYKPGWAKHIWEARHKNAPPPPPEPVNLYQKDLI